MAATFLTAGQSQARRAGLTVLLLGLLVGALPGSARGFEPLVGQFQHDFRTGPAPKELDLYNVEDERFFRQEPEGLHITIPSTWSHPSGGIGYRTTFGLSGDFEVSATFALMRADTPPDGFAVGVGIRRRKADSGDETMLARVVRPSGAHVIVWQRLTQVPGRKGRQAEGDEITCTDTVVRLRLKRTGMILSYAWAPGASGGEFQEIERGDFGADDMQHVRLVAMTNQKPCNLDGRFVEMHLRSGDVATAVTSAPAVSQGPRKIWYVAAGLSVLLLLLLGAGLRGRRRGAANGPAGSADRSPRTE